MNNKAVKDIPIELPVHYQILEPGEVEAIMSGLGPYKTLTPDECRELMDKRLGGESLSGTLIQLRRESRY